MRTTPALALVASAAFALTACTTTAPEPTVTTTTVVAEPTPTPTPAPEPPAPEPVETAAVDDSELTRLSVRIAWDDTSEADKTSMCDAMSLLGVDWGLDQMELGYSNQDEFTFDRGVVKDFFEEVCDL